MTATTIHRNLLVLLSLLLVQGIVACRSTSTDPSTSVELTATPLASADETAANLKSGFYPLQQGNRWNYLRTFEFQIFPEEGPPAPPQVYISTVESEIIGSEQLFGRTYTVQRDVEIEESGPRTYRRWARLRQDASGLFEADVLVGDPPDLTAEGLPVRPNRQDLTKAVHSLKDRLIAAQPLLQQSQYRDLLDEHLARRAAVLDAVSMNGFPAGIAGPPGGELSDEITRLRYPMHRGATWHIRDDPLFTSTVEGPEMLDLPIGKRNATRVRITPPGDPTTIDVFLWYNRCGLLRFSLHSVSTATDETGQVLGQLVTHDEQVITDIDLNGRNGCDRP